VPELAPARSPVLNQLHETRPAVAVCIIVARRHRDCVRKRKAPARGLASHHAASDRCPAGWTRVLDLALPSFSFRRHHPLPNSLLIQPFDGRNRFSRFPPGS
jgi:hypothetical protein